LGGVPKRRLTLPGGLRLEDEDGRAIAVASRKAQGVLAVLAVHLSAASRYLDMRPASD